MSHRGDISSMGQRLTMLLSISNVVILVVVVAAVVVVVIDFHKILQQNSRQEGTYHRPQQGGHRARHRHRIIAVDTSRLTISTQPSPRGYFCLQMKP